MGWNVDEPLTLSVFITLLGAIMYAVRGSTIFKVGNFKGWALWALFSGAVTWYYTDWVLALIVFAASFIGKSPSHGYYFAITYRGPNANDWLHNYLPQGWPMWARNTLAMTYIGFMRVALVALAFLPSSLYVAPAAAVAYGCAYLGGALAVRCGLIHSSHHIRLSELLAGGVSTAALLVMCNLQGT